TKRVGINSFSSFFTTVKPPFLDSFQAIARLWDFKTFIIAAFSASPNSLAMMTGNLLSPSRNEYSRWGGEVVKTIGSSEGVGLPLAVTSEKPRTS
nr:hypothetical protein [Tanacetum cinerariifolium]